MVKSKYKGCNKKFTRAEPCYWWEYWPETKKRWVRTEVYIDLNCGSDGDVLCLDCAGKYGIFW